MARGLGLVVVMLAAGLAGDAAAMTRNAPAVQRFVLPNGLTVVLVPNHAVPLVGMKLQYRVGMRDEPESRPGIAGLAQRLMVRATMHVAEGDYDRYLDAAGAFDAGWRTSLDQSGFWVTVPPEELALPLWMWSDQMGFLAGRLDERLIAQQLAVTKNERVQLRENGPAASVPDLIAAALYPPGHPYRAGRVRGAAGLQGLTVRELRAFVESHYTPDQAILVLVGGFDPDRARSLIEKYFGSLPPARAPPRRPGAVPPPLDREVRLHVAARVELPSVSIAWRTSAEYQPGDAELDVIAELLAGYRAGWLRWKLVDEMKIAARVSAHQESNELGSQFVIGATATQGHSPRELVDAIDRVLRTLQSGKVDGFSLRSSIAGFLTQKVFATERSLGLADAITECEAQRIRTDCFGTWLARYQGIDAGRLSDVAARELPLGRRVVIEVAPAPDAPIAGEVRERSDGPR